MAKKETKWIKHIISGQAKEFPVKVADEYLKSPSWIEVEMKNGKPVPLKPTK